MPHKTKKKNLALVPTKRPLTPEDHEEFDIDDDALLLTIETLSDLSQNAASLTSKRLKPLKAAVHNFLRAAQSTSAGSLTSRVSEALADARWLDARVLLAEFAIRGEELKLGTLQRWVRDVDAAAASGLDVGVSAEVFRTLEAILRTTEARSHANGVGHKKNPNASVIAGSSTLESVGQTSDGILDANVAGVITFMPIVSFTEHSGVPLRKCVMDGTIFQGIHRSEIAQNFKVVEVTAARERKPPNRYDATVYTSVSPLLPPFDTSNAIRHNVQEVPGAFVLENMLTVGECEAIVRGAEAVGFSADCAIAGTATQQASILAHNFYYYADSTTLHTIFQRALPHLPTSIEGCEVKGINARFRVYRYVPGAVYRPHIDGSWPRSGLDMSKPDGQQYIYDDTRDGAQLSRLTFLIYLNDDFKEGYTTFFIPSQAGSGLKGIRVEPRMGSVLVFPHGESIGALLHEGSEVGDGAKYIIRTDVLYEKGSVRK